MLTAELLPWLAGWGAARVAYASVVLADNPISYWRLGEASGATAVDERHLHDGAYVGTPGYGAPGLTGGTNTAVDFSGDDYVSLSNHADFQLTTGTIEAWIKTSAPGGGYRGIVAKRLSYNLYLTSGVLLAYDFTANADLTTGINLADGVRHHVVLAFNSGVTNGSFIYVDGALVLTATLTVLSDSNELRIGDGNYQGTQQISGTLDEVAVYGTALSAVRVQAHYQAGLAPGLPTTTIVSASRAKISRVVGYDLTDVVWSADTDFAEYQFRVVPTVGADVLTGVLVEQNQSPAAGGTATTQYTSTLTDAEVEAISPAEGAKIVKLFVKSADGTWSS